MKDAEDLERRFEGRAVLDALLAKAGALADSADVAQAFRQAAKDGVPAAVVISALWEDEPRFDTQDEARALYGNLLGLHELIAAGAEVDLEAKAAPPRPKVKQEKAPPPSPLTEAPDDDFVEAAWRYLEDHPKERARLQHRFENAQDALVGHLDALGLSDQGFLVARHLLAEIHAMLELGGKQVRGVDPSRLPATEVPPALADWVDEGADRLPEAEAARVREETLKCVAALWAAVA